MISTYALQKQQIRQKNHVSAPLSVTQGYKVHNFALPRGLVAYGVRRNRSLPQFSLNFPEVSV